MAFETRTADLRSREQITDEITLLVILRERANSLPDEASTFFCSMIDAQLTILTTPFITHRELPELDNEVFYEDDVLHDTYEWKVFSNCFVPSPFAGAEEWLKENGGTTA